MPGDLLFDVDLNALRISDSSNSAFNNSDSSMESFKF